MALHLGRNGFLERNAGMGAQYALLAQAALCVRFSRRARTRIARRYVRVMRVGYDDLIYRVTTGPNSPGRLAR